MSSGLGEAAGFEFPGEGEAFALAEEVDELVGFEGGVDVLDGREVGGGHGADFHAGQDTAPIPGASIKRHEQTARWWVGR
jgi:hypothetical protein